MMLSVSMPCPLYDILQRARLAELADAKRPKGNAVDRGQESQRVRVPIEHGHHRCGAVAGNT